MRPLWYEFPQDAASWTVEGQHLVGDSLLVAPVLTKVCKLIFQDSCFERDFQGGTSVNVHFPGEQQYWYDHWTHERLEKFGSHNVAAPYEKVDRFALKSKQETYLQEEIAILASRCQCSKGEGVLFPRGRGSGGAQR